MRRSVWIVPYNHSNWIWQTLWTFSALTSFEVHSGAFHQTRGSDSTTMLLGSRNPILEKRVRLARSKQRAVHLQSEQLKNVSQMRFALQGQHQQVAVAFFSCSRNSSIHNRAGEWNMTTNRLFYFGMLSVLFCCAGLPTTRTAKASMSKPRPGMAVISFSDYDCILWSKVLNEHTRRNVGIKAREYGGWSQLFAWGIRHFNQISSVTSLSFT